MAHSFGNPSFSRTSYSRSLEFEDSHKSSRVFLVAIHGGPVARIPRERNPMQRMRVAGLPANPANEFDSSDALHGVLPHALPPMPPALPTAPDERLQPRLIRGEILRSPEGRFYEKIGEQIRPLHKLVSGSRGQVLELAPSWDLVPEISLPPESDQPAESPRAKDGKFSQSQQHRQNVTSNQAGPVAQPAIERPKLASYRKLFPDPGQERVIRLGDFKSMLAPQLAHPERLRDTHRLACYLQVYEVTTAQRMESLAAAVLGDAGQVSQLQRMTEPINQQLGFAFLLQVRPRPLSNFPREAGLLLPYERAFRLQLAQDPTADEPTLAERQPAMNSPVKEPLALGEQPAAPVPERGLKTAIPERYIKPWEFKSTRDEALYDMNVIATFASWFSSVNRWLKGWIRGHGELKKWQFLLSGKNADDQLWAIPLPKGGVSDPSIRDWAFKTLETGGYEPRTMLLEWEIFWRRKGV
jgi:hypothetical protein